MPSPAKLAAVVVALALPAVAMPARAQERCSGTLCDLYYGGPAPETPSAAPSTAPKPLTVPTLGVPGGSLFGRVFGGNAAPATQGAPGTAAAPATRPMVGVQGGGLVGGLNGKPAERCSGTLCDFYYGSPSPEEQHAFDPPGAPATEQAAAPAGAPAPEPAADPDDPPIPAGRAGHRASSEAERCAATGRDPWSCYR